MGFFGGIGAGLEGCSSSAARIGLGAEGRGGTLFAGFNSGEERVEGSDGSG